MRKKQGMTLVEVVITLAVASIAFYVMYLFFSSSNRSINETDLKSKIQYETQVIQEKIATIGVESAGITELVEISPGAATKEINKITFKSASKENSGVVEYKENSFSLNPDGVLKITERDVKIASGVTTYGTEKIKELSKDVEYVRVKLINATDFTKAKSIQLEIKVKGKKGLSEKKLVTSTIITFRNYGL